jgi:hypothetical protein
VGLEPSAIYFAELALAGYRTTRQFVVILPAISGELYGGIAMDASV